MKRIFEKRCAFQTPIVGAIVSATVGVFSCAYLHHPLPLFVFLLFSLLLLLWTHGIAIKNGFEFSPSDRKLLLLLGGGFALLGVSCLTEAFRSALTNHAFSTGWIWAPLCFSLCALEICCFIKSRPALPVKRDRKALLVNIGGLSLLTLVLILLNLEIFDAWIRWDSYDYYYYISRITPKTLTDLDGLRLANHAAYAVSILHLVVNGIVGDYITTIYGLNVATLIIGSLLFWRILRLRFPSWKPMLSLLFTLLFSFSPFTLGLAYTIGLEWYLMFGLLIFFWADLENIPAMQVIGMLFICFSKETGVVILFAIMSTRLLYFWITRKNEPFIRRVELPTSLSAIALAMIWVVDLFTFNWLASNQSPTDGQGSGTPFNQFAFEPTFLADRLKSIVFSNFTWLILLVLLVGLLIYVIRKKKNKEALLPSSLFVYQVLAATLTTFLLTMLFVTYNHIRYAAPIVLLLLLLLPYAIQELRHVSLRAALCGLLAACSLIQCYVTLDPAMLLGYDSLNKGDGQLIYTDNRIIPTDKSEPPSPSISVGTQYNREILHFDQALDRLLAQIDYDEDTCLIFSGEYIQQSLGYRVYTEYLIMGFGYPHMNIQRFIAWDGENERRVLITDDSLPRIQICYANSSRSVKTTYLYFDRLVYIQLPFRDTHYESKILAGTSREEIACENYKGWELKAIEITDVH